MQVCRQKVCRVALACSGPHIEPSKALAATLQAGMEMAEEPILLPNVTAALVDQLLARRDLCAIIFTAETLPQLKDVQPLCLKVASQRPDVFRIIFSALASTDLVERYACCSRYEANMVSDVPSHVIGSLKPMMAECGTGPFTCPICQKAGLTEAELWVHAPQFHVSGKKNFTLRETPCPICRSNSSRDLLLPHMFEQHPPAASGAHAAGRKIVPIISFGLCVIQRRSDKKFLVVQEYDNQGFWLPGGGIDPGEFPVAAAQREAMEEAGVQVELTGVLRIEYNCRSPGQVRMRYIFFGHPVDEAAPVKSFPDFESVGACWVDIREVLENQDITWRSPEPLQWFSYVANGGAIFPMSILTTEGAPAPMTDSAH